MTAKKFGLYSPMQYLTQATLINLRWLKRVEHGIGESNETFFAAVIMTYNYCCQNHMKHINAFKITCFINKKKLIGANDFYFSKIFHVQDFFGDILRYLGIMDQAHIYIIG